MTPKTEKATDLLKQPESPKKNEETPKQKKKTQLSPINEDKKKENNPKKWKNVALVGGVTQEESHNLSEQSTRISNDLSTTLTKTKSLPQLTQSKSLI